MTDPTTAPPSRPTLSLKPKAPTDRQFVIWRRGGARPKVKHTELQAAIAELVRLRRLNPESRYELFELVPFRMGPRR